MVSGLILSGGIGLRLGQDIPKQYLKVQGKPILVYCLEKFEEMKKVDNVVVVAASQWQPMIQQWAKDYGLYKLRGFADAGASRQHSVWNGLRRMKEMGAREDDIVIIHDAVRPCVKITTLEKGIVAAKEADGGMPVLAVKDTIYRSMEGKSIDMLMNRDELYAGQTPESFRFGKYYAIHEGLSIEELHKYRGCSEIAHHYGLHIKLFPGDEENYKITTPIDLQKFCQQVEERGEHI